jgi:Divergent InlB B-repeat domain
MFSHELKLRALGATLLCAAGVLLLAPAAALASEPPVVYPLRADLAYSNSKTAALTQAEVFPDGQTTHYHIAWSSAESPASMWCTTHGATSAPEHELELPAISASKLVEPEEVELSPLETGHEYCVEAIATYGADSSVHTEQQTFTAGAPTLEYFAEVTGPTSAVFSGVLAPAGQITRYWVEYEVASSRWCQSKGKEGSSSHSAHLELAESPEYVEAPVELTALASGTEYCGEVVAENGIGVHGLQEPFATESILTVAVGGSGSGTVKTKTTRISCPGTCSATYPYGEAATLTAEPAAGSTFAGWGGACSGVASKCDFKMSADRTVTATFTANASPAPAVIPPPTNPPVQKGKPVVNAKTGEIEVEYEFPEPGLAETFGEVMQGATLASAHAVPAAATQSKKTRRCRKGYVKQGKRCVSNAPVRYGQSTLTIASAGTEKIHVKPSSKVSAALKHGKTLRVRVTLVFTPTGTADHITESATATVHLKLKNHHGKRRK